MLIVTTPKIFFYSPTPEIETVNLFPDLIPHNFYYANLIRFLKKYQVTDPYQADFFFVPINLIKFQFYPHFLNPSFYVENLRYLGLKPHLIFAAGDFGQRKRSDYENHTSNRPYPNIYPWLDERFILLAFESTEDLLPQDIGMFPYLLRDERSFVPVSRWKKNDQKTERDLVFSFVGKMSYPELPKEHIRGGRLFQLVKKRKEFFIGTPQQSLSRYGKEKGHHVRMFERSIFVLCPAGYGRWTFRLGEAIAYGAIPVLISDSYKLPFSSLIPWNEFLLSIPEKALRELPCLLRKFTKMQIQMFQDNLSKNAFFFQEEMMHQLLIIELSHRCKSEISQTSQIFHLSVTKK